MEGAARVESGRGMRYALAGYLLGFVLTAIFGAIVILGGDFDPGAQTGVGSDVGRTVMQLGSGQELDRDVMPIMFDALLLVPLWVGLGGAPLLYARHSGRSLSGQFGLGWRSRDLLGLPIGVAGQLVMVPLIYLVVFWLFDRQDVSEAARSLTDRANDPVGVTLLVIVVGIGAPVFEELFFRGLLLPAIADRLGNAAGLVLSSLVFGAVHFQVLQLPALVAFGLVAGALRLATGRLTASILAHVGFNAVTLAVLLASG